MKRLGYEMKRFTAMFLSACMVLQQGAVSTWAAESAAVAETPADVTVEPAAEAAVEKASASDASDASGSASETAVNSASETAVNSAPETAVNSAPETASSSDALADEDGFLIDGEVTDDLPEETVPEEILHEAAPKAEKIQAAEAVTAGEWYSDYSYTLDDEAQTITLKKYRGDEDDITVPAEAEIDGTVYATVVENWYGDADSVWGSRIYTLSSISFEDGVRLTGNVNYMFSGFRLLQSIDLSGADTSSIQSMMGMFKNCRALSELDLSGIDTGCVSSMEEMFAGCALLTDLDLSGFDTSFVDTMNSMFEECRSLKTLDLSHLDTGNVENMTQMFWDCVSLEELDLSPLDTKSVRFMTDMFRGCTSLRSMVLTGLDTRSLLEMGGMFHNCTALESVDMRGFNTSDVEVVQNLFNNCTSLKTINMSGVDLIDVRGEDTAAGLLANCTMLEEVWAPINLHQDVVLPVTMYDEDGNIWKSLPRGLEESILLRRAAPESSWFTDYEYDLDPETQTIILNRYRGDETDIVVRAEAEIAGVTYTTLIGESERGDGIWTDRKDVLTSIAFEAGVRLPKNCRNMFEGCSALTSLDLSAADTSHVMGMNGMFRDCDSLTSLDLSSFDTSSVADMGDMFMGCSSLPDLDISSFETSSVLLADGMLSGCNALEILETPKDLAVDAALPFTMYSPDGTAYTALPKYKGESIHLTKICHVSSVKINTTARTIPLGQNFQLKAWPQPTTAADRSVTWESSDPSVAAVDSTGLVMATAAGTAVVTVTTVDGGYTAECAVTVSVPVVSVKINTTARTIEEGKTFQLAAWPQPANATNKAVTWSSSDPSVAAVDSTGLVTAVKAGTADVTVTTVDGGKTADCKITVKAAAVAVTGVKINTTARTMDAGTTFQLAAWPQPANATNKTVTWSSSNSAVAKVNSSGLVTAVKAGTATITVKTADGGFTAACRITVKAAAVPVTSVKINTTAKALNVGATFQLAAWPQPTNATNKTVTWNSSNSAVAKVNSSGLVTAVKAGTATITVKTADGGFTAACKITVKAATVPVTSVKINTTAKTMNVGATFQLAAWPQPTNATNKKVTWHSFNTSVATVSSTGLVTAKGKGSTNVRVMTEDGGKIAYCKITVQSAAVAVTSVKINTTSKVVDVGKTFQLAAWPQPTNATNKNVTWTSSNTAVATVSSTGLVKGIKAGTATITVKTVDGGKTATCKIIVQTPAVILPGYQVSAPTNVHWTNDFRMAFVLGRTADGAAYPGYRIKICNAVTGTAVYDGFYYVGDVDQEVAMMSNATIEKMATGSYYYIIYAADEDWNQMGPEVQSETKAYTRPTERIPAASNLRWQGKKLLYDYPESSRQYTDHMRIQILYSATEDGTYKSKGGSQINNSKLDTYLERKLTEPGYYKVTIQMLTNDPQVRLSTLEVVESPVCHVTQ